MYVYVLCACTYVCFECKDNVLMMDGEGGRICDDGCPTRGGPVGLLDTAVAQVECA